MQVILAAMGGGAPGTMTAECAGALAAAECVVGARRGCWPRCPRAARRAEWKQRARRRCCRPCWKRGDTPPCALWRTAATRAFIPARAACCRCWRKTALRRGCCGHFQRAAFGRASGPPLAGLDARLRPRRGVRRGCGGVRRQTGVFPHGRHARPGRAVRAAVRSGPGRAGRDGGGEPFLSGRACDAGHRGAVRARCVCTAERAAGRGRAPRAAARARALRTARLHAGRCR